MGRSFEKRKHQMFARYDRMAKLFTRFGKQIAIAVKQSGPDPATNSLLRAAIQNAKGVNMPKERIDAAIKRASSKDNKEDFEEVVYEGYGPHAVAIVIETATDNPTRTVAFIRSYFNKAGGAMGKSGSLDFIFTRKSAFTITLDNLDPEELELELIDYGLEEIEVEGNEAILFASFEDFSRMQKALEERNIHVTNSEFQRIPNTYVELSGAQAEEILNLIEKIEQDDDVQAVFSNLQEI
jgi:YebC/PmpR family DNA-binding regulatory protein